MEDPVHTVERAWRRLVLDGCADRLAADRAGKSHALHQPLDGATSNVKPFAHHLPPDLARTVDLEVLGEDPRNLGA